MKRRHYGAKKLTRAQKAIVPAMMDAVLRSESRTVEEIEKDWEARNG